MTEFFKQFDTKLASTDSVRCTYELGYVRLTRMETRDATLSLLTLSESSRYDQAVAATKSQPATTSTKEKAPDEITVLLNQWVRGDSESCSQLVSILYPQLKTIAQSRMRSERRDHTLQPTALINEVFMRLAGIRAVTWNNRAHFLAVASRAMRRVLVDYGKMRSADKRPDSHTKVSLEGLVLMKTVDFPSVLEINELFERLEALQPRPAQVAELRCFGGLTHQEIAEVVGVDERTAKRDWKFAQAWLRSHLRKGKVRGGGLGTDSNAL